MKMKTTIRTGRKIDGSVVAGPDPGVGTIGQIEMGTRDIPALGVTVILILRSANMKDGVGVGLLQRTVQVIEGHLAAVAMINLHRDIVFAAQWMMNAMTLGCMITGDRSDIVVGNAIAVRDPDGTPFQLHVLDPLPCRHLKAPTLGNGNGLDHQSMH